MALINREALLEKIQFRIEPQGIVGETVRDMVEKTREIIMAEPTVEVAHGRWIEEQDDYMICATFFTCSNCKDSFYNSEMDDKEYIATMKYCPNCGAKMDGEAE